MEGQIDQQQAVAEVGDSPSQTFKLFVGQLPKNLSSQELNQLFQRFGDVVDTHILRNRDTQQSKGCGFVTFGTYQEGQTAIETLHDRHSLEGMARPLQVKWADNTGLAPASEASGDTQIKVFLGSLPKHWAEDELKALVEEVVSGAVSHVFLLREATGESKGAGFVTVPNPEIANQVIVTLHNNRTLDGMERSVQARVADSDQGKVSTKLFVGQIGGTTREQMERIFVEYGDVENIDMVTKQGMPQGCAFVHYRTRDSALNAINSLNGKFKILDAKQPLVVRFAETQKEKDRRLQARQSPAAPYGSQMMGGQQGYQGGPQGGWSQAGSPAGSTQKGPAGSNLYVSGLPSEWSDANLAAAFGQFGVILSAKVFVDKVSKMSRGFGFVSFDNPSSAAAAISTMHACHVGNGTLNVCLKESKGGQQQARAEQPAYTMAMAMPNPMQYQQQYQVPQVPAFGF